VTPVGDVWFVVLVRGFCLTPLSTSPINHTSHVRILPSSRDWGWIQVLW